MTENATPEPSPLQRAFEAARADAASGAADPADDRTVFMPARPAEPAPPVAEATPPAPVPPPPPAAAIPAQPAASPPPPKRSWLAGRPRVAEPAVAKAAPPPPPPPPPRRRRNWSKRAKNPSTVALDFLFNIAVLVGLVVVGLVDWGMHAYSARGPLEASKIVNIGKGSTRDVADLLHRQGVIDSTTLFLIVAQTPGNRDKLRAGEYQFPAGASMREVMDIIGSGKVVQHAVTIPEGLTSEQVVERLKAEDVLVGEVREPPPEGSLLPETYHFPRGTARSQVLATMAQAQKKLLDEIWAKRDPAVPVRTPQQLVTLASIVEKETGIAAERPRVAAVFVNRLERGMRLQSDPTIIYGLVGGKGTLGRPITKSEISRATPYNTYVVPGLPPGPIANPGRASMEAVAHPASTNDLFFVADGSGGHAFATTLDQHSRNVAHLREIERARGAPAADRSDPADDAAAEAGSTAPPVAEPPQKPAEARARRAGRTRHR
jgi:UPF0755 protein